VRRWYTPPKIDRASDRNAKYPVKNTECVVADAKAGAILKKSGENPGPPIHFCFALPHAAKEADFVRSITVAPSNQGGRELLVGRRAICWIAPDPTVPPVHPATPHLGPSVTFEAAKTPERESIET